MREKQMSNAEMACILLTENQPNPDAVLKLFRSYAESGEEIGPGTVAGLVEKTQMTVEQLKEAREYMLRGLQSLGKEYSPKPGDNYRLGASYLTRKLQGLGEPVERYSERDPCKTGTT